ncbi:thioesterase [Spirochaetia bacterium]|nr:thioesterase [Spirochaetia bacterium]
MVNNKFFEEMEFKVEFYDVDPMNVVWHGNYVKYFEKIRCALLKKIGYDYLEMKDSGFAFPVTSVSLKFISSFSYGDTVRARAFLSEYQNCIKLKYELYNSKTGMLCTKGESTQMVFNMQTNKSSFVCPDIFIGRVEEWKRQKMGEVK